LVYKIQRIKTHGETVKKWRSVFFSVEGTMIF